jgi:hypothetical protein
MLGSSKEYILCIKGVPGVEKTSILSPLLGNIYLHALDVFMEPIF